MIVIPLEFIILPTRNAKEFRVHRFEPVTSKLRKLRTFVRIRKAGRSFGACLAASYRPDQVARHYV